MEDLVSSGHVTAVSQPKKPVALLDKWSDVAFFFRGSEDPLLHTYGNDTELPSWLIELLPVMNLSHLPPNAFQDARYKLTEDPAFFIHTLRGFAYDFNLHCIGMEFFTEHRDKPAMGDLFTFFCTDIRHRIDRVKADIEKEYPGLSVPAGSWKCEGDVSIDCPTGLHARGPKIALHLREARNMKKRISHWTKNFHDKVVDDYTMYIGDKYLGEKDTIEFVTAFENLASSNCTTRFIMFVKNVVKFVEIITGVSGVWIKEMQYNANIEETALESCWKAFNIALNDLQDFYSTRQKYLKPIHDELTQLRNTVERQRQVITALEYRHVLEHLPDRHPGGKYEKASSPTDAWKSMWKDIVMAQIMQMRNDRLVAVPGSSLPPPPLESALRRDFNKWWPKNMKKTENDMPDETELSKWEVFQYGDKLYNLLSRNIHNQSGEGYKIHTPNWPRPYVDILKYLTPTNFVDHEGEKKEKQVEESDLGAKSAGTQEMKKEVGEVDWKAERGGPWAFD